MPRHTQFLICFGLASAIIPAIYGPPSASAQNEKRAEKISAGDAAPERVFDPENRDYHLWDQKEEAAYRRYWDEQRRAFRPFSKLNARQQCHYWTWRHKHPGPDPKPS